LEVCLNEIEQGTEVDAVLSRYPDLADELRPMLETSAQAKKMSVPGPSQEIVKRNRAKLLQRAAEMREEQIASSSRRVWSVPLRRMLVTLMVVAMLFISSTGLVRASSNTLPGDNLYPVKRTWEDMMVFFTFDADKREELEFEHENERLEELHELFAEGRSANVDFAGYVTRLSGDEWRVSGITVFISSQTRLPDQEVLVGAAVRVRGQIQNGISVMAERVDLLPPGSKLPEVEDDELEEESEGDDEEEEHEGSNQPVEQSSGKGSEGKTGDSPIIIPTPEYIPENESINGVVTSIEDKFVIVNGILMDIRFAQVEGVPRIGAAVEVEGYFDADGILIVTKIKFKVGGSGIDNNPRNNNDDSNNINSNDDDSNDNDNDDDDDDDNKNDNDNEPDDD